MSNIDALIELKKQCEEDQIETNNKFQVELNEINDKINKLEEEFLRKVRREFKGVNVAIRVDRTEFRITIGSEFYIDDLGVPAYNTSRLITLINYTSSNYVVATKFIDEGLGKKLRNLYIEYFGEL